MPITVADLVALNGKQIKIDKSLFVRPPNVPAIQVVSFDASLIVDDDNVRVAKEGSDLSWIPYVTGNCAISFVAADRWFASAPFSGCKWATGRSEATNEIFGAHIAQESGSEAQAQYEKFSKEHSLTEWFDEKIPIPNEGFFSCSYIFTKCSVGGIEAMVRLDVQVNAMGGSDGKIFNVQVLKGE